jgi:predicted DNA-binding protein with PD1-like motif
VVSFVGNITLDNNGKPSLHAHCVVALSDGSTRGGHLIEGHVSLAMQVFVVDSDVPEEAKQPK